MTAPARVAPYSSPRYASATKYRAASRGRPPSSGEGVLRGGPPLSRTPAVGTRLAPLQRAGHSARRDPARASSTSVRRERYLDRPAKYCQYAARRPWARFPSARSAPVPTESWRRHTARCGPSKHPAHRVFPGYGSGVTQWPEFPATRRAGLFWASRQSHCAPIASGFPACASWSQEEARLLRWDSLQADFPAHVPD